MDIKDHHNTINSRPGIMDRPVFREAVFLRDKGKCVYCGAPATAAHHILDRSLWSDDGYYLDNGVALCDNCHIAAEKTLISCDELREAAGITNVILPCHLYTDLNYDKWGNQIVSENVRVPGELFYDAGTQAILTDLISKGVFSSTLVKYPRTFHVRWSEAIADDEYVMPGWQPFKSKSVVVTEKMDGENTTMMKDRIYARSLDSRNHPSRNWVKNFWGSIAHDIPEGWRVCGENVYAKHSIYYDNLPSYFLGFSIWTNTNICLPWAETLEWFELLGITPVPVLYTGFYCEQKIKTLYNDSMRDIMEGYVIRHKEEIPMKDFPYMVGKFVRKNHVTTTHNWMNSVIVPNRLKE